MVNSTLSVKIPRTVASAAFSTLNTGNLWDENNILRTPPLGLLIIFGKFRDVKYETISKITMKNTNFVLTKILYSVPIIIY